MKKLSRYAAKGWLLDSFAFMGYSLRRGEPQQLTYCIDYNAVSPDELESYLGLFEASGWTRVCTSQNTIHIFSAPPGTKPIYTDSDTRKEKYKQSTKMLKPLLAVPVFTIAMLALLLLSQSLGSSVIVDNTLKVLFSLGLIFSVPILMTYSSYLIRLNRSK